MAGYCAPIGPNEIIIDDNNYLQFVNPVVDGETKRCGTIPRNYFRMPRGSVACAGPFDIPLLPESEWQPRLEAKVAAKAQLSNIRDTMGPNGGPIPSTDQNGRGYCHIADTECLTSEGWVQWPDYNWKDPLATVNPVTGMMEYQHPLQRHVYEYDGEIIHSTNRRIDFGVTPDHKMLVRKWDEKRRALSDQFTSVPAGQLGWYVGLPHAPEGFMGTDLRSLSIEGDRMYSGDDFLALVALVVSDGWVGNGNGVVSFCCFDEKRYGMVALLAAKLGIKEQPGRRGVWTLYSSHALAAWFRANCYSGGDRAANKRVPDLIKVASMRQIRHFLEFFGDQDHEREDDAAKFYSSSKRLIDDLQELHLRISKRGTISKRGPRRAISAEGKVFNSKESWELYVSKTNQLCLDRKKHIETDRYKGLVYCAGVPNGTLITRRNGSVLLAKNCWCHSGTSACLLVRALNNQPFADLSAYMVGCIIKNYRDEGGWGLEGVQFLAEHGIPDSKFWPQRSASRSNDTPEMRANAKLHRVTEWMELPSRSKAHLVTCLLLDIPVVADFNWWGHSVCAVDLVSLDPFRIRIWNSWGDNWSEKGMGILEGSKAIPDDMTAPRVLVGSET